MAKSSRSKWKKQHRRIKAETEKKNTQRRLKNLNKKLHITSKGGISQVPTQDPERRFHFLNPELDPNVPNTRKFLNNNYKHELNEAKEKGLFVDFRKPLHLSPPKTNFRGKSDPTAPHPTTFQYDELSAMAPIAGRALSKADMERIAALPEEEQQRIIKGVNYYNDEDRKYEEQQRYNRSLAEGQGNHSTIEDDSDEEIDDNTLSALKQSRQAQKQQASSAEEVQQVEYDMMIDDGDGPEEYIFGLEDPLPVRVGKGAAPTTGKIKSMQNAKRDNKVVSVSGNSKVKALTTASVKTGRKTGSGSTAKKQRK